MGRVLVGTASWTDKSLVKSGWYPEDATSAEARLKYYASQFPLVEVDSTYYYPPRQQVAQQWAQRTPSGVTFNLKACSVLTQHPTTATSIRAEMRPAATAPSAHGERGPSGKQHAFPKDLHEGGGRERGWSLLASPRPFDPRGKPRAGQLHLPPWSTLRRSNKHYLVECAERAAPQR